MTDDDLTEVVIEEASEHVDVAGLLEGERVEDQVDASRLGESIGTQFGEAAGRELGAAIGRRVHEVLVETVENEADDGSLVDTLKRGVRTGITDALEGVDGESTIVSSLASIVQDEDEEETEAADEEETEDEATEATDEAADVEDEPEALELEDVDASDLAELRQDTIEEYLETISYRELQSIAKDVDVKANLARDEMTARIVETVTDESAA